ncbi:MAG: ABC transporter permease [Pseudonocardiaceae bacterium]
MTAATTTPTAPPPPVHRRSPFRWLRRLPGAAAVSLTVIVVLALLAVVALFIAPLDTRSVFFDQALQAPSPAHPMGTDSLGRDLFTRVLHGMRNSFGISIVAALCAAAAGTLVGLAAGALGRRFDAVAMRLIDVLSSQNHFLFGILILVLSRPLVGPAGAIFLSVGVTHWTSVARIVRGEVLALREQKFVAASVNAGAGRRRLARRHFLPHVFPAAALGFVLLVPHAIFHEAGYSFLGLGMPPESASLGNLLADSQSSLLSGGWWASLFPGLVILLASMAVGTLGEWWRDRRHPRWRSELQL